MSPTPSLPEPADCARPNPLSQRDEDAQYYRGILHELVEMATDIARAVHRQATAEQPAEHGPESDGQSDGQPAASPTPDPSIAFDRIARTIRRTIALARKLSEPVREAPGPKCRLKECPEERRTDRAETDALHAEPCDRPEQPDFDADEDLADDLDEQSLADLIASLRHDTDLATLTDAQLRQRRTPQSTQERVPGEKCGLCARAAQPTTAQPRPTQPRIADPRPLALPPPSRTGPGPPPH